MFAELREVLYSQYRSNFSLQVLNHGLFLKILIIAEAKYASETVEVFLDAYSPLFGVIFLTSCGFYELGLDAQFAKD